jgi:hypothetical protein
LKNRIIVTTVCLLLVGCGTKPKKPTTPTPTITRAIPSVPAGEKIPGIYSRSLKSRILAIAKNEWAYFGQQKVVYTEDEESIPHVGYWEDDDYDHIDRVNMYWRAVRAPGLSGRDCQQPWSAAFISWVMDAAGVSEELFPPAKAHWVYLSQIVSGSKHADPLFFPRTIHEYRPKPGDLICASREAYITPDIDALPRSGLLDNAKLHCDIVVAINGRDLEAIGGNVRNSVSKSILNLTPEGYLQPTHSRRWFMIVENRLF